MIDLSPPNHNRAEQDQSNSNIAISEVTEGRATG
jgi:hypothetical protein